MVANFFLRRTPESARQEQQFRRRTSRHGNVDQFAHAAASSDIGRSPRSARPKCSSSSTPCHGGRARRAGDEMTTRLAAP